MTLMPLPHGNAGTIPIPLLRLLLLILVKPTGTQRRAQRHLMLRQSLDHHGGNALIGTVVRVGIFGVFVAEGGHGLEGLFHGDFAFFVGHVGVFGCVAFR